MAAKIGTAGWNIPAHVAGEFPSGGSSLERYSRRLNAVEINSSFHRPHRISTWERWHDSVPESFRFSVKLPKAITHERKLVQSSAELAEFLSQAHALRGKLAVLLVQLPPKLALDRQVAAGFFRDLSERTEATVACEPRHISWFTPEASDFLEALRVARVAADPALCPAAAEPGGAPRLKYWRLHGSPVMYRSSYQDRVHAYAAEMKTGAPAEDVWCIFDNTASSQAAGDALKLAGLLNVRRPPRT